MQESRRVIVTDSADGVFLRRRNQLLARWRNRNADAGCRRRDSWCQRRREVPRTRELPTVHFDDLNLAQVTLPWPVMVRPHDAREAGELCRLKSGLVLRCRSRVIISSLTGLNLRLSQCLVVPVPTVKSSRGHPGDVGQDGHARAVGSALPGASGSAPSGRAGHFPGGEQVPAEQGLDGQCGGTESDGVRAEVAKLDRGLGEQMPQ
ncbi:MAG: hypothetical protein JWM19_6476 [Actinomycetia bacterium]|nr:hypothetical protein [Actinomycetes bacterium]